MVFIYREVTVSGANQGVEGSSGIINAMTDLLVDCGWSIEDDRRAQPGSTNTATTHKVVLVNNGGETGTYPNWYLTIVSGTSATQKANTVGLQVSTSYDIGAHTPAASGISHPTSTNPSSNRTFVCDSDGFNALFMSADKEGIALINNYEGIDRYQVYAGRVDSFLGPELEPYGIAVHTLLQPNPTVVTYGIVGNNPPQELSAGQDATTLTYLLTNAQQPSQNLGQEEASWVAVPIMWVVQDASPARKGAIGYFRNMFAVATDTAGVPFIGRATVSGTGQEFRIFSGSATSLALRAS
jgi:hypothetical protein